jgi:hypothetical protein
MVAGREVSECVGNPKVAETCLAVPSNQDVVLDVLTINMRACSFLRLAYRSDATMQNV